MTGPVRLASGRDADVFAVDAYRVLRRYRQGGDVAAEASVMAYVAELGFPVPIVYAAKNADLVMERLDGPTLLDALIAGNVTVREGAELLADLHGRLHELPSRLRPDPGVRLVHLDLHPANVMFSSRGPVVIDWRNATEGRPDLDLAMSALILAQVAVDPTHDMAAAANALLTGFLGCAGGDPLRMLDRAHAMRRADPAVTTEEIGRLASATILVAQSR